MVSPDEQAASAVMAVPHPSVPDPMNLPVLSTEVPSSTAEQSAPQFLTQYAAHPVGQPFPQSSTAGLTHVRLVDFRNYAALDLHVESPIIVLTGANGAGKTNVLEALSMLSPGRGLRRAALADFARIAGAGQGWGVKATIQVPQGENDRAYAPVTLSTGLVPGESRRSWHVGEQPVRSALALAEQLRLLWFVPDMGRLFAEGPSGRRRFMDRLVFAFEPLHAEVVARYESQLKERWLVLKHDRPDAAWLDPIEAQLVEDAVAITRRRQLLCHLLSDEPHHVEAFPNVFVAMRGSIEVLLAETDEESAKGRLRETLRASRVEDRHTGGASIGPHKSDMHMVHVGKNLAAHVCSTGEQKILLLSSLLKFAHLWRKHSAIPLVVLLDDVAAHLDVLRRTALMEELWQLRVQAWLTGTERKIFAPLGRSAQFFHVENGCVKPYDGANAE